MPQHESGDVPVLQIGYKCIGFLSILEDQDVAALPPVYRRQLADLCAHWARRAEAAQKPPASGVLCDLRDGARDG